MTWTPGIWPLSTHPTVTKQHLDDLQAALTERGNIVNTGAPIYTYTYRNYRNALIAFKDSVAWLLTHSGHGQYFTPKPDSGNYNDYFSTHLGVAARPPKTGTEILDELQMPTNFLTYTPYRGLTECGFVADPEGVNGMAGYQNDDTLAGGTNFPAGRTYWTTTDYGFDGVKNLVSKLCWAAFPRGYAPDEVYIDGHYDGHGYEPTWAACKTEAEAGFGPSGPIGYTGKAVRRSYGVQDGAGDFDGHTQTQTWHSAIYYCHDGTMHCDTDFYVFAEDNEIGSHDIYDNYGLPNLIQGQHALNNTVNWSGASGPFPTALNSNPTGLATMPTPPWCDEPVHAVPTEYYSRGVIMQAKFCIFKFDVAGGLQYV